MVQLAGQLLAAGQRVIAPARVDDLVVYKALASAQEMLPENDYILPRASFKEFFFPRTECILRYQYDENNKARIESPELSAFPEQVILGCRPCDAASLPIPTRFSVGITWTPSTSSAARRRRSLASPAAATTRLLLHVGGLRAGP